MPPLQGSGVDLAYPRPSGLGYDMLALQASEQQETFLGGKIRIFHVCKGLKGRYIIAQAARPGVGQINS